VLCENRTGLSSLEGWRLCRSAKSTLSGRRGSRTLKAHRSTVFETAAIASWLALPFKSCGGRNRTCVGALNRRLSVPARTPPQSSGRGFPCADCLSAQRESNPHFRHGKAAGCRYIMGAYLKNRIVIPERASWVKSSWRHSFLVASPSGFVKCFNWTVGCGWNCGVVVEVFLAGCLQPSFLVGCIPIHPFVIPSA
jgi:hypothetical protein